MITSDEIVHLLQVGAVLAVGWHAALYVGRVLREIILVFIPNQNS